jgi:hypothetical protein
LMTSWSWGISGARIRGKDQWGTTSGAMSSTMSHSRTVMIGFVPRRTKMWVRICYYI